MNSLLPRSSLLAVFLAVAPLLHLHADGEKSVYNSSVRVKTLLRTSTNAAGQPIVYPEGKAEVSVLIVEIPPGRKTGWHIHPVPIFGYVLAGQVTVEFANGEKHTFTEGQALAEAVNLLHQGTNEGKVPTRLLIFVAGKTDSPFTIKAVVDSSGKPVELAPKEKSGVAPTP